MAKTGMLIVAFFTVTALPDSIWAQMRPNDLAVGIGAGWDLPADITQVNLASVRLRLSRGITLEPRVELGYGSQRVDLGPTDSKITTTSLILTGSARIPLFQRGKLDFLAVGGAALEYVSVNPSGDNNNAVVTGLSLIWGLSIEYWLSTRWSVSLDATNPLFNRTKSSNNADDASTTNTNIGIVFDPDINLMAHLYY
ncbi:MAG: porin family protein [Proteobacteria bacterium]|nr:porin family protein [Pseudomonadota bacterium]